LTKITGQDKKSVAGRTTLLKNLGLIEKVSVLAKSLNTSKLTLTKFAFQRETKRQSAQDSKEPIPKRKGKKTLDINHEATNAPWTGPTIDTERLIKAIVAELKVAKNQVLMHSDLKRKLVRKQSPRMGLFANVKHSGYGQISVSLALFFSNPSETGVPGRDEANSGPSKDSPEV
jgi:hypothetical protein